MTAKHPTADSIFCTAQDIQSREERDQYVAEACGDDVELKNRVQRLLNAHFRLGDFMQWAFDDSGDQPTQAGHANDLLTGSIGPYKLLQVIGEGGMGTVYMAEQTEPVQRRVALKLIKAGMDTRQVVARFEAERQALAVMDHPNIARVLDAGATDTGRPYFVMELVKGKPITKFCDEQKLDTESRLRLFQQVCHAVQHAHQKGIIHRDIKPSNVLVAMYDDQPVPKVIDFGVAKATGEQLTEKTMFTRFGQIVGTLEYMSPEQAQFNQLDIDTRSDIYSLGAILYELLTGEPPFEREKIRNQPLDETLRMIREEEPTKPSTKLSGTAKSAQVASNRKTSVDKLGSILRGDLDWIVMTALDKDRTRRYETANGLALDIARYIDNEPVSATPPSALYRVSKMIKRNKLVCAAGLFGFLFLVATTGILVTSNYMLAKSERKATASLDQAMRSMELVESLFEDLDLWSIENDPTKTLNSALAERLVLASEQLDQSVGDQLRLAQIQDKLGNSLVALGFANDSVEVLENSYDTKLGLLSESDPELVKTKKLLAVGYRETGKPELLRRATNLLEEVVAYYEGTEGALTTDAITSMRDLASCFIDSGEFDRAIDLLRQAHRASSIVNGPDHSETVGIQNSIGTCYWSLQRHEDAIPVFQEVAEYYETELGSASPYYMNAINNLGQAYVGIQDYESALPLLTNSYDWARQNIGHEHPTTRVFMNNLALLMVYRGEVEQGAELLELLVELSADEVAKGNTQAASAIKNLAACYHRLGKTDEAILLLEDTQNSLPEVVGPVVFPVLLQLYMKNGQSSEALTLAENDLKRYGNDERGDNKAFICEVCLLPARKFRLAEKYLKEALSEFEARGDEKKVVAVTSLLVQSLVAQEKFPEAETHLLSSHDRIMGVAISADNDHAETAMESFKTLIDFYGEWNDFEPEGGHDLKQKEFAGQLDEFMSRHSP